jgi:hypothetical protein
MIEEDSYFIITIKSINLEEEILYREHGMIYCSNNVMKLDMQNLGCKLIYSVSVIVFQRKELRYNKF